jgi:hypothetical protein
MTLPECHYIIQFLPTLLQVYNYIETQGGAHETHTVSEKKNHATTLHREKFSQSGKTQKITPPEGSPLCGKRPDMFKCARFKKFQSGHLNKQKVKPPPKSVSQ